MPILLHTAFLRNQLQRHLDRTSHKAILCFLENARILHVVQPVCFRLDFSEAFFYPKSFRTLFREHATPSLRVGAVEGNEIPAQGHRNFSARRIPIFSGSCFRENYVRLVDGIVEHNVVRLWGLLFHIRHFCGLPSFPHQSFEPQLAAHA